MTMSTLHHYKHSPTPPKHHMATSRHHAPRLPIRIFCTLTTSTKQVVLASMPPPTLTTELPQHTHVLMTPAAPRDSNRGLNYPSLHSTWAHRAWLVTGCSTLLACLAKSVALATAEHALLEPLVAALIGYLMADLGSGVYHWGIDNYGDASTPVFGSQIEAFQGHHKQPWTITRRQFSNNLHALARAITFSVLPFDMAGNDPTLLGFVAVFSGCIMFSQQFHAWAHSTKSKLPPLVVALQDRGVLVSRSQHAAHHRPPYNGNYCIVSGVWNSFLDENRVFEALEMALFFQLGVRPRSWSEPNSEWTEEAI